jgi:hypothetical protein
MFEDCRAGRRDAFARNTVVVPVEALQDRGRRGRRHRQKPVRGAHEAGAARQRGHSPNRAGKGGGDAAGADNVEERIPVGDLVEMHRLHRHAMDRGFGLGDDRQDRDGVPCGAGMQRRCLNTRRHGAKTAVDGVVMIGTVVV